MSYFKFDKSRRQFLRGTGGTFLAIPFMPSLAQVFGQESTPSSAKRFVSIQMEDGHLGQTWRPELVPAQLEAVNDYIKRMPLPTNMSYILDSKFDSLRSSMITTANVDGPFMTDHNLFTPLSTQGCVLPSYVPPPVELRYSSIDHYIAESIYNGMQPPIKILNLALLYHSSGGTVVSGSRSINGSGEYVQSDAYGNLASAWNYIFGGIPANEQAAAQQRQERLFIADKVNESFKAFLRDRRLSNDDKATLRAHIEQMDDLEQRIATQVIAQCTPPLKSTLTYHQGGGEQNWPQAANIFFDMMVAALKCDLTRVINFRFAPNVLLGGDPRFNTAHHGVSHSGPYDVWTEMDKAYFDHIHYFVSRLQSEGLLDNTLVFCTNEIGNYASRSDATMANVAYDGHHDAYDMQVLTFGLSSVLKTGYHYWFDVGTRRSGRWNQFQGIAYNEFLVTIMHALGVPEALWKKPGVNGYGDYRGDQYRQLNVDVISPSTRRGKPLVALLK